MATKTKGSNYEYWADKHEKMLQNGWDLFLMTKATTRRKSQIFNRYSTPSGEIAKEIVEDLRNQGNCARIICGYSKNKQRIKMFSIIFKPKTSPSTRV